MGPGAGRAPSSGSGPGPGLASAPDRATHLVAARLSNALLELGARDLGPARARRQEVRGGKRKRRPNSAVLSASATLPEPNRPASRSLTSARALRRSGERRLTLCRAVVARRRRAKRGGAGGQRTGPPSPSPSPQTASWCELWRRRWQVALWRPPGVTTLATMSRRVPCALHPCSAAKGACISVLGRR